MKRAALILALLASPLMASLASAQSSGPISCIYDKLSAADRQFAGEVMAGFRPETDLPELERRVAPAAEACIAEHKWVGVREGIAAAYAMQRTMLDAVEKDYAEEGLRPGGLAAAWNALVPEDRGRLLEDNPGDTVLRRVQQQLIGVGMPRDPEALAAGAMALSAISDIARQDLLWSQLPETPPAK